MRHPISGDIIKSLKTLESFEKLPVRGIRFYPMDKNKLYLGGAYGTVEVFDLESGAIGGVSESKHNLNFSVVSFRQSRLRRYSRSYQIFTKIFNFRFKMYPSTYFNRNGLSQVFK